MLALSTFSAENASRASAVVPEVWTKNFPAALEQAQASHRPLVMMASKSGCPYCLRLRKALSDGAFKTWLAGTGIYLAEAHFNETNASPDQEKLAIFVENLPHPQKFGIPKIGVYWPKGSNDEVKTAFNGFRGRMPGKKDPSLVVEFASALTTVLPDYFNQLKDHPSIESVVSRSVKRVQFVITGNGKVTMSPESGELKDDGVPVVLKAKAGRHASFVGWKTPSGRLIPRRNAKLMVSYEMESGTYTAVFE